jgi:ATP-dependent helicase/nuclease subunit B
VLDYKTSDQPVNPRAAHVRRPRRTEDVSALPDWSRFHAGGEDLVWIDLQLPLYRQALAAEFGPDITCGYFNLPKGATETAVAWWDEYDATWQRAAEQCAAGIAAAVAAGRFWPPAELPAREDDFASLFPHGAAASITRPAFPSPRVAR